MTSIGQYDYEGLIKSYLAQDRNSAKTAQNRMSYNYKALYSYKSKLAEIFNVKNKILLIDKEISIYSKTTIKQTHKLSKIAKNLNWQIFTIDFDIPVEDNLNIYWERIEKLILKHKRSRKYKDLLQIKIKQTIQTAQNYAKIFNLDPNIPDIIIRKLFIQQLLN